MLLRTWWPGRSKAPATRYLQIRPLLRSFLDLGYLIRSEAMGLLVDGVRGFRVRCLHQAEDLALLLVEPVLDVVHPMLFLGFEVLCVSVGHSLRGQPFHVLVVVHIQGHRCPPLPAFPSELCYNDGRIIHLWRGSVHLWRTARVK